MWRKASTEKHQWATDIYKILKNKRPPSPEYTTTRSAKVDKVIGGIRWAGGTFQIDDSNI